MTRQTTFLVFLFCLLSTFSTYLSGQEYSYHQYTLQDGLVQMQVQCLFQDSRGYIWVGTKGGVSKFDGDKFENFRQQDGLLHPFVYAIDEDSKGNIWFATAKGLTKFNGQELMNFPIPDSIKHTRVLNMFIDKEENIWFNRYRTHQQHTLKFDGQQYTVIKDKERPSDFTTYGIEYDPQTDKLLVAMHSEGLGQIAGDTIIPYIVKNDDRSVNLSFEQQLNSIKHKEVFSDYIQTSIIHNKSLHPLWKYNKKTKKFFDVNYSLFPKDYFFFKNGQFMAFRKEAERIDSIQPVNFNQIKTIFIDKSNTIWIGSEEGLIQFFGEKGFKHYASEPFTYVWDLVEDKDQKIWFCGYDSRLKTYDNKEIKELKSYEQIKGMAERKYFYFGGLKDNNDNLLFPMGHNILRYDGTKYSMIESKGITNAINLQLWEDKEENFIIAGVRGGINIIENYQVTSSFGEKEGIHACSYIVAMGKDKNNEYWLGSFQGVSRLNLQTKEVQIYTKKNNKLPSDGIISMTKDSRGNMWFGSRNGLLAYDYETDSIHNISPDLNTDISYVFPIDDDHLMLGAIDGLYVLDLASYYGTGKVIYKYFNHKNGYLGVEPTQNTFLKDSKGQIWLASATSVDKFDPQQLDLSIPTINTRITHLNREKIAYNTSNISLPEGKNTLEFRFEGIGFERPLHNQYAYQLVGHDEGFSTWGKEDFSVYSNLGSGKYTFKVKSRMGSYTDIEPSIACIDINIDLPFWKEPDFYQKVFYILPLLIFLIGSYLWKTLQNRKLATKNQQIAFLNKELSHRVKNNLQFITSLLSLQERRLSDAGAKAALNESRNRIQVMSSLHRRLYQREDANINLSGYIEELKSQFLQSYSTQFSELKIKANIDNDLEIDAEKAGKIGLIINELVMNSIKHAFENQPHPEINISVSVQNEKGIILLVQDNGSGILESVDLKKSKSLGMKLISNLVEQLKGDLAIKNNNGLQFEFSFQKLNLIS